MLNLESQKFFVTGTIIFMTGFIVMMVFPLEKFLLHFAPANIALFASLILTLLCT
ncbi:MAG: hypothetical protein ACI910_003206, partial [Oleispira sp.]